jgi:Uma2 family endonuclease
MADAGILCSGERMEFIEGKIVTMSPQNSPHATCLIFVSDVLRAIFASGHVIRIQLPLDLSPSSQPEPDIAVVSGSVRDYAKAHPTTALLAVEVAESTVRFDRGEKASLYANAGVPEYWVVHLRNQRLEVFRDPVPMTGNRMGMAIAPVHNLLQSTRSLCSPIHTALFRVQICCLDGQRRRVRLRTNPLRQ